MKYIKPLKSIFYLLFVIIITSCHTEIDKVKNSNNLEYCIENLTNYINDCFEGSNQIEVDEKAYYDFENDILTVYKGKSLDDYFQKWEIPFRELDFNRIVITKKMHLIPYITIYAKNEELKIKYYKKGKLESNTFKNSYYFHDYCLEDNNSQQLFLESYKRAIFLVQNKNDS